MSDLCIPRTISWSDLDTVARGRDQAYGRRFHGTRSARDVRASPPDNLLAVRRPVRLFLYGSSRTGSSTDTICNLALR